jgi:uncharacterized protein (TIGR03083 family)
VADLPAAYLAAKERVVALVRDLDDHELATPVPACPGWTIHDVIAHLAGVTTDIGNGVLPTAGAGDAGPAAQVLERRDRPLDDLLAEWDRGASTLVDAIAAGSAAFAFDVVTHEQDVRGAVKRPGARDESVEVLLGGAFGVLTRNVGAAGLPAIRVDTGAESHVAGEGEPVVHLAVDRYELTRGAAGRRSERQLRAWDWTGDPEPYLGLLTFLPMAESDISDD